MKKKIYKLSGTKGLNAYCVEDNKEIKLCCKSKGNEELISTYNKNENTILINGKRKDPNTKRFRLFDKYIKSRYKKNFPWYIAYEQNAFRNHKYCEGKYKEPKHYMDDDGSVWYRMPLHSYIHSCWIREDDKYIDIIDYGTKIARYKRAENIIIRYGKYSNVSCRHFIWFADMICYKTKADSVKVWLNL